MNIDSSPTQLANKTKQGATIMAIELDGQHYYLPQVDLITFENTQQLRSKEKPGTEVATILIGSELVPVYCLSKDFELLDYVPDNRKVCIVTGYKNKRFGILCDKIHKLNYTEIKFEPVPACMAGVDTPVSSLFLYRPDSSGLEMGMMLRNQSLMEYLDSVQMIKAA